MTRRNLLKNILKAGVLASFSQILLSGVAKAAAACTHLIDMTGKSKDPNNAPAVAQAKNLKYVSDVNTALKSKETMKPASKDQTCKSCQQYNSVAKGCGKCNLINFGEIAVHENGWCMVWSKKA